MVRGTSPYVGRCAFCDQGLLRLLRCGSCQSIVACCDECELIWSDVASVFSDPQLSSTGAFPACPRCGTNPATWEKPTLRELRAAKLERYIGGRSK